MGFGDFVRGVGTGAATGFLSRYGGAKVFSKLALGAGPQGAILGASLFALSYFLRPKNEEDRPDLFESEYPNTISEVLRRDVLGHIRTGGIRYYYYTDESNLSLTSVWIVGDGPMEGVNRIKINDKDILFSSVVRDGKATISSPGYGGLLDVWVRFAADGVVNSEVSSLPNWNGNLDGISYVVIKQTQPAASSNEVDSRWNTGFPTVEFEVRGRRIREGVNTLYTENPLRLARWFFKQYDIEFTYDPADEAYCDAVVGGDNSTIVSSVFAIDVNSYDEVYWVGNSSLTKISNTRYGFDASLPAGRQPNSVIPASVIQYSSGYSGRVMLFDYERNGAVDTVRLFTGLDSDVAVSGKTLLVNYSGNILNLDFEDAVLTDGSLVWTFTNDVFHTWITTALPNLSSVINVFMAIVDTGDASIDYDTHVIATTHSGDEPRYRFGSTVLSSETPLDLIPAFERAINGRIVLLPDGTARGFVGRIKDAVAVIQENQCIGSPVYHVLPSPKEYFNRATASIRVWPLYVSKDVTLSDNTTPN